MEKSGDTNLKEKQRIPRGSDCPVISMDSAITAILKAAREAGTEFSTEHLASALGLKTTNSSTYSYRERGLRILGLITKDNINKVRLTPLAERILNPTNENDVVEAKLDSFFQLEILKRAQEHFKNRTLPQNSEHLANALEQNCGAPTAIKMEWAKYFVDSGNYVGLIKRASNGNELVLERAQVSVGGIVTPILPPGPPPPFIGDQRDSHELPPRGTAPDPNDPKWASVAQPLMRNGTKAFIGIPDGLTKSDVRRLCKVLDGLKTQLEGLIDDDDGE